jgi:hypothetical protein
MVDIEPVNLTALEVPVADLLKKAARRTKAKRR